jgi:hypothetical protein
MLIQSRKVKEDYFGGRANCSDAKFSKKKYWKKLWDLNIPPKIRIFIWRLALNSIPTATVLNNRNMSESAACRICGAGVDDWRHAILNCTMSRCVWALMDEDVVEMFESVCITDPKRGFFIFVTIYRKKTVQKFWLHAGQYGMQEGKLYMKEHFRVLWRLLQPSIDLSMNSKWLMGLFVRKVQHTTLLQKSANGFLQTKVCTS